MTSTPREAIILAGGLARRMGDNSFPKWLTPVGNATIAEIQLVWLRANGITKVLCTLNERYRIPEFSPFSWSGLQLGFLWEKEPVGDEGGLNAALEYAEDEVVLVVNGDVLTDLPLSRLPPPPAMVVVHPRAPWGVVQQIVYPDGHWRGLPTHAIAEKPLLSIWVNSGIYCFPRSIRGELVSRGNLAHNILPKLLGEGQLKVVPHEGLWLAIETVKDAEEAAARVKEAL